MTKGVFIILFAVYLGKIGHCQPYINENYDCDLLDWKYEFMETPNKLDTLLIHVDCLVIRNRFNRAMAILDSLIGENPSNLTLHLSRIQHKSRRRICSTIYFDELNEASILAADKGKELLNLGIYYLNYISSCEDSTSSEKLLEAEKLRILDRVERIVKRAAINDKNYLGPSYEIIYEIISRRARITNKPTPTFSLKSKFDTLLLISELPDCGEFGGHMEYIKCYYSNEILVGRFWKDNPICQGEISFNNQDSLKFKTLAQPIDFKLLDQYVNHVLKIDKKPPISTNAPTSFWLVKDGIPHFTRDWSGNSEEYEVFRNSVFKE